MNDRLTHAPNASQMMRSLDLHAKNGSESGAFVDVADGSH